MIERYSRPEMSALWTERNRLDMWKEVEMLATEAWVEEGVVPAGAATAMRQAPEVDVAAWKEREKLINHDMAAFVDVLAASMTEGAEWVHYGLTSSDVIDTAQGAILAAAADLLLVEVAELLAVTKRRALEHRDTVMIGRTHGIWAEPTTFGLKLATWAFELARDHERLSHARQAVAVGKISGAVGTYAHVPPVIEEYVCSRLGIGVEPASTQVTHRDRHAELVTTLAIIGSSLERFATEIRHLQRSEVGEVHEAFGRDQKGSSAMPHKRNPIASENLTGVSRLLRGYASAVLENVALWHERDISHSSVERVVLPDATIVLDYALARMTRLVEDLVVDESRMLANLESTGGVVYSQAVLLALVETGLSRDDAYRIVQRSALAAWDSATRLREHLEADAACTLDAATLDECLSPERFLRNAGVVFERLEKLDVPTPS